MKTFYLLLNLILISNIVTGQWEPDVRLTNDLDDSWISGCNAWNVACSGDTIHVAWYAYIDDNSEIFYKRSIDGGLSWGVVSQLTQAGTYAELPSLAVSGSTVHLAWQDDRDGNYEIYYKRSTDGGSTWEPDVRLTDSLGESWAPSISVTGPVVNIVWEDYRDILGYGDIYFKRSVDGGLNWGSDIRLSYDPAVSSWPSITGNDTAIHVFWQDKRDGNFEIYTKRSMDGGATWEPDTRLSFSSAMSIIASPAVSGSKVHIAYYDNRYGNFEVVYKRSDDQGVSWGPDVRLTDAPNNAYSTNICAVDSTIHIVWEDYRDGNGSEIYYLRSIDGGVNWETEIRLTDALDYSDYPSVAVSGSVVHVVWADMRDGNYEIYYKRNPTGGTYLGSGNEIVIETGQQFITFPNPASNYLNLKFDNPSKEKTVLTMFNILNEEVMRKEIQDNETTLDLSGLQNGFYFLNLRSKNGDEQTGQIIISK